MPSLCRDVYPAPRQTRFPISDAGTDHIRALPTATIRVSLIEECFYVISVILLKDSIPPVFVRLP